jgi:hypothetical protein
VCRSDPHPEAGAAGRERVAEVAARLERRLVEHRPGSIRANPDADSKLPYLVLLPLGDGIVLKARESWPATARVYCHRVEGAWPTEAEIIEETRVRLCRRRGVAIDLALDRPRLARSQFVVA